MLLSSFRIFPHLLETCKRNFYLEVLGVRAKPLSKSEAGICNRVRLVRESLGKTRAGMAELLGISPSQLDHIESRRSPVRYLLAFTLTNHLSVNAVWLALGRETPFLGCSIPHPNDIGISPRTLYSKAFQTHIISYLERMNHPVRDTSSVDESEISPNFEISNDARTMARVWLDGEIADSLAKVPDYWVVRFCDHIARQAHIFISSNSPVWVREIQNVRGEPFDMVEMFKEQERLTKDTLTRISSADETSKPPIMETHSISQRLNTALEKTALTQSKFAEKYGLNKRSLENWLYRKQEPRGLYRERLEKILSEIEGSSAQT